MITNTELVNKVVRCLFSEEERHLVTDTLEKECAESIPLHTDMDPKSFDRLRLSIIRVTSEKSIRADTAKEPLGTMEGRLRAAVDQAHFDWRDSLVSAGFGDDAKGHLKWARKVLEDEHSGT